MSNINPELKPFVLRKFAQSKNYPPINWSLNDLPKWLKNDIIQLRIASMKHEMGKIIFEKMCLTVNLEAEQFIQWLKGEYSIPYDEEEEILSSTHWAYYDYKPAADNFVKEFTEALSFDKLGINGKFSDETVWIGSPGAYTPCHYDSYGYNLHLQLKGTKRWILFPPETDLSPSRIPYEESTIYSLFDIIGGQLPSNGKQQQAYCTYLNEGDLLFIPPKWWHSVLCSEGDERCGGIFSVNKWFPLESDEEERKKECIVGCLASLIDRENENSIENQEEQFLHLDSIISEVLQIQQTKNQPINKKPRIENEKEEFGEKQMYEFYNKYKSVAEQISPMSFNELKNEISNKKFMVFKSEIKDTVIDDGKMRLIIPPEINELPYTENIRKLLNAFTHESTLENVLKLMQDEI
uniref:JmjC domain-containing protein n=1 Tax=Panagrolaimus davidi TaxID=227884 RepID=A0A914QAL9_9BILA